MQEYTIHPLAVGINETDQGVMTYLRDYGKRIYLPVYVFYLSGGGKNILVDTGLEQFVVPEGAEEHCGFKILEFEDALATLNLNPENIDIIIHTHLHNDHCENDHLCTKAEVYVQKKEYEFMLDPHPVDHRYYPDVLDDNEIIEIDGDDPAAGRRNRKELYVRNQGPGGSNHSSQHHFEMTVGIRWNVLCFCDVPPFRNFAILKFYHCHTHRLVLGA